MLRDDDKFREIGNLWACCANQRAGSSIPANIAESCGRGGDGEFQRFLEMAMGSAIELEFRVLLGRDLGFMDTEAHDRVPGNSD